MNKALLLLILTGCSYSDYSGTLKPFVSDGCSGRVWITLTGGPGPWQECCVEHDKAYWKGGTREERLKADERLRQCVAEYHPLVAEAMYLGVRIGGHPSLPTSYRWGFGWEE